MGHTFEYCKLKKRYDQERLGDLGDNQNSGSGNDNKEKATPETSQRVVFHLRAPEITTPSAEINLMDKKFLKLETNFLIDTDSSMHLTKGETVRALERACFVFENLLCCK